MSIANSEQPHDPLKQEFRVIGPKGIDAKTLRDHRADLENHRLAIHWLRTGLIKRTP